MPRAIHRSLSRPVTLAIWATLLVGADAARSEPLRYVGVIDMPTVKAFIAQSPAPRLTLTIDSPGGDVAAGILLGEWVSEHELDVVVEGICASSCANYVLPAARRKAITAGALVVWHGGAHQADFEQFKRDYLAAVKRRYLGIDDNNDRRLLLSNERFENLLLFQSMEWNLYQKRGIAASLPTLGQCGTDRPQPPWTLTKAAMASLGLGEVETPQGYGSLAYVEAWRASRAAISERQATMPLIVLDAPQALEYQSRCNVVAPNPMHGNSR